MKRVKDIQQKQKLSGGVNTISVPVNLPPVGVGWVVLNSAVDDYVRYCMETSSVSLFTTDHELLQSCFITKDALQQIEFPVSKKDKGSLCVWVNAKGNNPIVIGVLNGFNEKNSLTKDASFQLKRSKGADYVLMEGITDLGTINIVSKSVKGGQIKIRALHDKVQALIDMYVQGKLNVDADDEISIRTVNNFIVNLDTFNDEGQPVQAVLKYEMGKGFTFIDQWNNQILTSDTGVKTKVGKNGVIEHSGDQNALQNALLGNNTIKTLSDILDVCNSVIQTVAALTTTAGSVTPDVTVKMQLQGQKVKALKKALDKLKSKNVKLS